MTTLATLVLSPKHVYPGHPEEPDRLSQVKTDRAGVDWISAKPALPEEIARVHTKELVEGIRQVCEREPGIIDYAPTYVTSTSYDDSLLAAKTISIEVMTQNYHSHQSRNAPFHVYRLWHKTILRSVDGSYFLLLPSAVLNYLKRKVIHRNVKSLS